MGAAGRILSNGAPTTRRPLVPAVPRRRGPSAPARPPEAPAAPGIPVASPSVIFRRAGLAFGLSLVLASAGLLLLLPAEEAATLAAEPPSSTAWSPAPLLALLIVAAMSGLVLLVGLRPRRG